MAASANAFEEAGMTSSVKTGYALLRIGADGLALS